jgi:RNase adaptor protein for sRNA GlmZ degradation
MQQSRLANARRHANLYVDTSPLAAHDVAERVTEFLASYAD